MENHPRKILILTADAGYGHRAAANAIAAALAERYGDRCTVTVLNPLEDPRAPALLRVAQDDYDRVILKTPELYRLGYEVSDGPLPIGIAERALVVMLYTTMRDVLRRHAPDAIVTTYPLYQAPIYAVFALSSWYCPVLTVVTDLATVHGLWFNTDVDKCLAPTEAVMQKAIEGGLPAERVELTGLPVSPAFAQAVDPADLRARLGWRTDRYVALMAGSKRVTRLEPTVRVLNHSGLPLEFALVSGGDEALRARWMAEDWHAPAHVYGYVDDMPSMMLAADFIVCKAGGLIVSEALAAGLPPLLVEALPGQETGNVDHVVRAGAGAYVEDPIAALETVCHWLVHDAAELAERRVRARRVGKPDAAFRAAELAWQAALTGPQQRERRLTAQIPWLRDLGASLEHG